MGGHMLQLTTANLSLSAGWEMFEMFCSLKVFLVTELVRSSHEMELKSFPDAATMFLTKLIPSLFWTSYFSSVSQHTILAFHLSFHLISLPIPKQMQIGSVVPELICRRINWTWRHTTSSLVLFSWYRLIFLCSPLSSEIDFWVNMRF